MGWIVPEQSSDTRANEGDRLKLRSTIAGSALRGKALAYYYVSKQIPLKSWIALPRMKLFRELPEVARPDSQPS